MKRYLLPLLLSAVTLLAGCEKKEETSSVKLVSITKDMFDFNGGMGTAVVDAGERTLKVSSSASSWCKVAANAATVNFNISKYTQLDGEDRTATITVEADGLKPLTIDIMQTKFEGVIVTPTTLTFSASQRTLAVQVTASEDYTVELTENPNGAFSGTKTATGAEFTSNFEAGALDVTGRANIIPSGGGEPVVVTLVQPAKSMYDNILGNWEVSYNKLGPDDGVVNNWSFTFERDQDQRTYKVTVNATNLIKNFPFKADFVNGKVRIQGCQKLGTNGEGNDKRYLSLHYNGTSAGSDDILIFTAENAVGWDATPVVNEAAKTITMKFADNGQGGGNVPLRLCFYSCAQNYFEWYENGSAYCALYEELELKKTFE